MEAAFHSSLSSQASTTGATIQTGVAGVAASAHSDEDRLHRYMPSLRIALASSALVAWANAKATAFVAEVASDERMGSVSVVRAARASAQEVAHRVSIAQDAAKKRAAGFVAVGRDMAADPKLQITAAGLVGGAATLGTSGGATGLLAGSTVGAAVGLVPALFTFGFSIPIGATVGAAVGCTIGTAVGSTVGALGGSMVSYSVYAKRVKDREFAARMEAALASEADVAIESVSTCTGWTSGGP